MPPSIDDLERSARGLRPRLVVLGGFLGAGKTTTLALLAHHYAAAGRRVGIITNDQGDGLVDTELFRGLGLATREVTGGCFCCRFDDLLRRADEVVAETRPDVLLAEPVGSCTDLLATVIRPMRKLHGDRFAVSPLAVVVDPIRALNAFGGNPVAAEAERGPRSRSGDSEGATLARKRGWFSEKVTYIFRMQQQEADCIAINKIDLLGAEERIHLRSMLVERFPKAMVLGYSARTGAGFEDLLEVLEGPSPGEARAPDIDYDIYAEGEAELGWLNRSMELVASAPLDVDSALVGLAAAVQRDLRRQGLEVAHAKFLMRGDRRTAVANLVSSEASLELSQSSGEKAEEVNLVINLRVQGHPRDLEDTLRRALASWVEETGVEVRGDSGTAFSPPRPVPTHRIADQANPMDPEDLS